MQGKLEWERFILSSKLQMLLVILDASSKAIRENPICNSCPTTSFFWLWVKILVMRRWGGREPIISVDSDGFKVPFEFIMLCGSKSLACPQPWGNSTTLELLTLPQSLEAKLKIGLNNQNFFRVPGLTLNEWMSNITYLFWFRYGNILNFSRMNKMSAPDKSMAFPPKLLHW